MISLHYPADRVARFRCANTIIYIQGIPESYGYRSLEIMYYIKDIQLYNIIRIGTEAISLFNSSPYMLKKITIITATSLSYVCFAEISAATK